MKVFVYNGSFRENNSFGELYFKQLKKSFENKDDVEFYYHNAKNTKINQCLGCKYCFEHLECKIKDDMYLLKGEMLTSDVIVLISPVFLHNVSGSTKAFIDRISYWTHLMRLTGKFGVIVSVADGTGNEFVNSYLKKIFMYLGILIIDEISLQLLNITTDSIKDSAEKTAKILTKSLSCNNFVIPQFQELIFKYYKDVFSNFQINTVESQYWINNGYLKFDTFQEFFTYEHSKANK